jgi:predicted RNA-binding protein with PIN domain
MVRNKALVTVISSDTTIQATIGGVPITRLSSDILVREAYDLDREREQIEFDNTRQRMTIGDRLDPATRAKLNALLGRG